MRPKSIRQTALALSLAASAALAAEPPRVWDVPGALQAIDVPGRTVVNGVPVAMHAVRSRDGAESLERSLREQFEKAGLWLGPASQLTRHRQVTGLDVDTLVAYTAFLQANPDRSTTVVFSETFLAERAAQGEVKFAPVMPGAGHVLAAHTEGAELAAYRVKAKPGEVQGFYAETLGKAGWVQRDGKFERGLEVLDVQVKPRGPESAVTLTWRQRQ